MDNPASTSQPTAQSILLKASVLMFLFRALAGVTIGARREEVSSQLLLLISEFAPCREGYILLGRSDEEIGQKVLTAIPATSPLAPVRQQMWSHVLVEGPWVSASPAAAAIPIYAGGSLAGVMVLSFAAAAEASLDSLTAIASIASVAIESAREVERLREDVEQHLRGNGGIVGASPSIVKLLDRIERVANRETTVLIQGESGTGKELVAHLLHRGSARAEMPFVAINCAAIADSLLESELFGHEKGAFTGAAALKRGKIEMASGGTLFLDEIGELAAPLQAKLLRVLAQREFERVGGTKTIQVDVRIVAATNRDLAQFAHEGKFREDLYHRINVVTLRTPALRERKEDIPMLAEYFLRQFGAQCARPHIRLSSETLRCLENYDWPGNVRELQNAMEHAVVMGDGDTVLPSDLPESVWESAGRSDLPAYQSTVNDAKRESILRAYEKSKGDYKGAAAILGLHPNYLLRLVRNLGLKDAIRSSREVVR